MIVTTESGRVFVALDLEVEGTTLKEKFFPFCANAVQTELLSPNGKITVRPDTYTKPVRYTNYE